MTDSMAEKRAIIIEFPERGGWYWTPSEYAAVDWSDSMFGQWQRLLLNRNIPQERGLSMAPYLQSDCGSSHNYSSVEAYFANGMNGSGFRVKNDQPWLAVDATVD
jgi:hypothetical protein